MEVSSTGDGRQLGKYKMLPHADPPPTFGLSKRTK
jgi:hypothetical protein